VLCIIALSAITSLQNYKYSFTVIFQPDKKVFAPAEVVFKPQQEITCMSSFKKMDNYCTVLSCPLAGQIIPRFSDLAVVNALSNQCEKREETRILVSRFYQGCLDSEEMTKFLDEHYVQYVYYGVEEQILDKNKWVPEWLLSHGWKRVPGEKDSLFQAFQKENHFEEKLK
jgi:hypothetical protein